MRLRNPNPKLRKLVDLKNLKRRIKEGYISVSKVGTHSIYCYTAAAQHEQVWDNETMTCRGLIVDHDRVVGRPFPKFFNYGQVDIPSWCSDDSYKVAEKMDGSLGICFWNGLQWQIATKGSFASEQAKKANEMLTYYIHRENPNHLGGEGTTTLFEIIYPENRVVVNYGTKEHLVHLATINNRTGEEVEIPRHLYYLNPATEVPFSGNLDNLASTVAGSAFDNEEGVVATWYRKGGPAFRLKFKNLRYLKLHSLMTNCTARKIWTTLKNDGYPALASFIMEAPDEFQTWAHEVADRMLAEHHKIQTEHHQEFLAIARTAGIAFGGLEPPSREDRKRFAQKVADTKDRDKSLLFKLLDGKSIDDDVWDKIYPPHETPFMVKNDD
jgi:putative RNA ligase